MKFDLLIQNAQVVDGTGQPAYSADIAINGKRIAAVYQNTEGNLPAEARRTINAKNLTVIPGLIDPHSHADLILPLDPKRQAELMRCKISQGITTTIVGNCGLGCAPVGNPEAEAILRAVNSWMTPEPVEWSWRTIGEYLNRLKDNGLALNIGTLAPHGPIRISAMGLAKGKPSRRQMKAMRSMVEQAMADGAFGLSTGLIYPPGMYSETEELIELAKIVSANGGIYTSHIRGSSETLIPAVKELLDVARSTGVRVHHSHNEAVGRQHWPKIDRVLQMEKGAVNDGVVITSDMFPYTAAATMMIAIYPPWALEGGVEELIRRLTDSKTRRRIERDIQKVKSSCKPDGWPHNLVRATGWEAIFIGYVASRRNKRFENCSLTEFGSFTGKTPFDAISDLIIEERGQVSMLIHEVSGEREQRDLLAKFASHQHGVFCTDAEDYGRGLPHPAAYGAFPRIFARFVREDQALTFEEAVRKMTSFTASIFGIRARGVIRRGAFADLVILDPKRVNDLATFEKPRRRATGIKTIIINGREVFSHDNFRNEFPGEVIRYKN